MVMKKEALAQIAEKLRQQPSLEIPVKHEWVELVTSLSQLDDTDMRAIGIVELQRCVDREQVQRDS